MARPEGQKQKAIMDEVIAGEFVLGAVSEEVSAELIQRIRHDRAFALMVERWRENVADVAYYEQPTGGELFVFVDEVYRERTPISRYSNLQYYSSLFKKTWSSVGFWRFLVVVLAASAIINALAW